MDKQGDKLLVSGGGAGGGGHASPNMASRGLRFAIPIKFPGPGCRKRFVRPPRETMTEPRTNVVYKYFDLIDGFVQVRSLPEAAQVVELSEIPVEGTPPDRRTYRRMVVRSCIIDLDDQVLPQVSRIYPDDLSAAEDLLYQICVDVNPHLEIHSVSLPAGGEAGTETDSTTDGRRERARNLESRVLAEVVGQDAAVVRVCRAVRKAASGLNDPDRPVGAFLLVGRTGVGKTELAKSVARNLTPSGKLIRVDCSEFALPHETAKLIGAPPGYIGHGEGGMLTESILENPDSVVLFDEVEKGHETLHNMLLQILDEGRLTDSKGQTVPFDRALVLLTSNVGTADYAAATSRVGFAGEAALEASDFESVTQLALRRSFRPEMLNRLDEVLVFGSLNGAACERIAELALEKLSRRVADAGVGLAWSRAVVKALAAKGRSEEYGAREIRRVVAREVEEPVAEAILDGTYAVGSRVRVGLKRGEFVLQTASDKRAA